MRSGNLVVAVLMKIEITRLIPSAKYEIASLRSQ